MGAFSFLHIIDPSFHLFVPSSFLHERTPHFGETQRKSPPVSSPALLEIVYFGARDDDYADVSHSTQVTEGRPQLLQLSLASCPFDFSDVQLLAYLVPVSSPDPTDANVQREVTYHACSDSSCQEMTLEFRLPCAPDWDHKVRLYVNAIHASSKRNLRKLEATSEPFTIVCTCGAQPSPPHKRTLTESTSFLEEVEEACTSPPKLRKTADDEALPVFDLWEGTPLDFDIFYTV